MAGVEEVADVGGGIELESTDAGSTGCLIQAAEAGGWAAVPVGRAGSAGVGSSATLASWHALTMAILNQH